MRAAVRQGSERTSRWRMIRRCHFPTPHSMSSPPPLVINFIADRPRALSEMRRVLRAGGLVAGFVWDFEAELSPRWPLRLAMRQTGADVSPAPGTRESGVGALTSLFDKAGFEGVATRSISVTVPFPDFDAFWHAQTPGYSLIGRAIAAMTTSDQARLIETVRAGLPVCPDVSIQYSARERDQGAFAGRSFVC